MKREKLMITCPICNKSQPGKPIMLKQVEKCECGHIFTEEDKQKGLEEIRAKRKAKKEQRV